MKAGSRILAGMISLALLPAWATCALAQDPDEPRGEVLRSGQQSSDRTLNSSARESGRFLLMVLRTSQSHIA